MKAKNLIRISLDAPCQLCKKMQFRGRKVSKMRWERSAKPAFERVSDGRHGARPPRETGAP